MRATRSTLNPKVAPPLLLAQACLRLERSEYRHAVPVTDREAAWLCFMVFRSHSKVQV